MHYGLTEVYNVQKLIEGSTKYAILKETNIIEVKLEDNLDLSNLQSLANTQGYIVTENDPMKVNDSQELVYYLIDESAKKSTNSASPGTCSKWLRPSTPNTRLYSFAFSANWWRASLARAK